MVDLAWTVYSSSQNLASVLNDPSKPRSSSDNIFTKDWGAHFIDSGQIMPSPFLPKISHTHFDCYMKKVIKRTQRYKAVRKKSMSIKLPPTRNVETFVPKIFLSSEFSLENLDTFKTVLTFCSHSEVLSQFSTSSPTKIKIGTKEAIKELQRNLSEYLDIVEENLARQVSMRSKDFFQVMSSMDTVMDQLSRTIKEVTMLRRNCTHLDETLIAPSLRNIQLTKCRNNASEVYNKIKLMSTVHQTQPTIQLLLSSSDFVGALDLISTSQEVVAQELTEIHSFRYF